MLPALSLPGGRALAATPRLRTRLFAASCILDLPAATGGDPRHFDAVKAQVMDVPSPGDLSPSKAALACTYTFVCTTIHMPDMRMCMALPGGGAVCKVVQLQLALSSPRGEQVMDLATTLSRESHTDSQPELHMMAARTSGSVSVPRPACEPALLQAASGSGGDWLVLRLQMLIDIAFKMATGQVEALRPMGLRLLKVGRINALLHCTFCSAPT